MRLVFAEEEDFPGQASLWEANVERSLKGARGQAALRRLEAALLALPEKTLVANAIEDVAGHVCALGALAKHEGYQGSLALPKPPVVDDPEAWDEWDMEGDHQIEEAMLSLAAELQVPRLVAQEIIYHNDNDLLINRESPEQRYWRMLSWVRKKLINASVPPAQ